MKKTVTAVLLSMSMLAVPVAQAQMQQNYVQTYVSYTHTPEGTDAETNINPVLVWRLAGAVYTVLKVAIDVAKIILKNKDDSNRAEACEFLEEHDGGDPDCYGWDWA